jgi:hypothetical protein
MQKRCWAIQQQNYELALLAHFFLTLMMCRFTIPSHSIPKAQQIYHVACVVKSSTISLFIARMLSPIEIKTGVISGKFPRRVLNAVLEWYVLHKDELIENWEFAEKKIPLKKIEPLE